MSPAYRTKSARQGLITFLIVIGIILSAWLLLWPQFGRFREARQTLKATVANLQTKQSTMKHVDILLQNYRSRQQRLAVLEQVLPDSPAVPQLLANLESLAVENSMQISGIRVTDTTIADIMARAEAAKEEQPSSPQIGKPELIELKIDFTVSGEHENFIKFLDAIERNQRLLEVKSVNVEPVTGVQTAGLFILVINTSYQK